jgi:hypothetical protein
VIGEDRVTIVVATRDRRCEFERSLPHHEAKVIVIDNGSVDGDGGRGQGTPPRRRRLPGDVETACRTLDEIDRSVPRRLARWPVSSTGQS